MRVRIVGDGTFLGTRVESEDGRKLEMVTAVEWRLDAETRLAEAKITLTKVPVDVEAEVVDENASRSEG